MDPKIAWPVVGKYPITFDFGERPDWYLKIFGYPHNGIDIGCPIGTPVLACDTGQVIFADDIPDGDGCGIILKHDWGISLYWHLSTLIARWTDLSKRLDRIGLSGNTGYVTGPHLHFGIKVTGVNITGMRGWVDPVKYLREPDQITDITTPVNRYHFVIPGDSLWSISEKYFGSGFKWRQIYEANRDKIANPNVIFPGQKLLIP